MITNRRSGVSVIKDTDPPKTKQQLKREQMLASGEWKEGEQGELVRVRNVGVPSKERLSYLEGLDRPLTESEAREYASASFDPSSNMNVLFGLAAGAGFDPVGEAAMGLLGSGSKAVGKGISAMKATSGGSSKYAPGGDPVRAMESGLRFVSDFYSDPYIQKHFKGLYGEGKDVTSTFSRGQSPIRPETHLDMRRQYGALGAFDKVGDKVYIDKSYFGHTGQKMAGLEKKVKEVAAHETAHYADAPMFTDDSQLFEAGSKMVDNLRETSHMKPTDSFLRYHQPTDAVKEMHGITDEDALRSSWRYWNYLIDPREMTANAMEVRLAMERAIFESDNPRIAELFKNIGDDESFSKLMVGDFSDLNDFQYSMLMRQIYNNVGEHTRNTMRHVLKGANDRSTYDYTSGKIWNDQEKKKSISDWLKYALMVPVAGAAATQAEMAHGGKVKAIKRK